MPFEFDLDSQQRELDELRKEVAHLRDLVGRMSGGYTPPEPPAATASEHFARSESADDLHRELTRHRFAEEQLRVLASVVENAVDGVMILTPAVEEAGPRIAFVNRAFCTITGYDREDVIAETIGILRFAESDSRLQRTLEQRLFAGEAFVGEAASVRRTGQKYTLELQAIPVKDAVDQLSHWIVFARDVTDRRTRILDLERRAQYDSLTDLPNRVLLFDRLEQAVLAYERRRVPVGLMLMDLDRFKEVNDSFGHEVGDTLLKQVAFRLRAVARKADTIARLGGDEFAVMLPEISGAAVAGEVAKKFLKVFETPFLLRDRSFAVGASIGTAICPDHGQDAATLLRCADIAMYQAKRKRSGHVVYSPDQEQNTAERLLRESDLRLGMERDELEIYFQPIVDMRSGRIERTEVLSRWQHPSKGLIYPDDFIPVAESSGLIKKLTVQVLNDSLRQCRVWKDRGIDIDITVNLSPSSLHDASMTATIAELLERWRLDPSVLRVEITENTIMADPATAMAVLSLLRSLGVTLSLDDFGTGYSSLANLRQVPFDELKIDKSFVTEMMNTEEDATIVKATIDLAHNLGRHVVAEGVENAATWERLKGWGCDLAQGYFIRRPVPAAELEKWMASRN